ncbi:MAG: hypothetical protein K6F27_03835 [Ruminococcus sp.]|nr:hypothetical protein [Ruminococcus sp.]
MMYTRDTLKACEGINGWEIAASFAVGGFEWLAFSKQHSGKMIIISSQRTTLVDCDSGLFEDCDIAFDENELIAYCDKLADEELELAGQYGGSLPTSTDAGERVDIASNEEHIMQIRFTDAQKCTTLIYDCYDAYICGFSYDGGYFVLSDDGGIVILKKVNVQK